MAIKTTRWDSADYLHTEEARASYLAACMDEAPEDPAFITHALGVVARSRNMSQLARDTGLTREGLYKALSEDGNPSFGTVLKVVHALGYRLSVEREDKRAKPVASVRVTKKQGATKQAATRQVATERSAGKRSEAKQPRKATARKKLRA